jgi:integration host factor subunit alpha
MALKKVLTKAQLVEEVYNFLGLSKRESKEIVEQFFEEIKLALEEGHIVKISGFGNFVPRFKRERPGRNPKTGEHVSVSARQVITFKPGQKLKASVELYGGARFSEAVQDESEG